MFTEIDGGDGLVKSTWDQVRNRVYGVEEKFAEMVDDLSPDATFPVYLAYIPYGSLKGDTESPHIPKLGGGFYKLNSTEAPKEIIENLGYGKASSPLGMVLSKCLEYFIDMKEHEYTIPWAIAKPGEFFPYQRMLSIKSGRVYSPNGVLKGAAGARSVFVLPSIGCVTNYSRLKRSHNIQAPVPKKLYQQWYTFRDIASDVETVDDRWRCCVLYFSEKWLTYLHNDPSWLKLKDYLLTKGWLNVEYSMSSEYYDYFFSVTARRRNIKANPYLIDTMKHIFKSALGVVPGYAPLIDNEFLPVNAIQKVLIESYGLDRYIPSIMGPSIYEFESNSNPIYYSLQYPSTQSFLPKSKNNSTTLQDLDELKDTMRVFQHELSQPKAICSDTILGKVAKHATFGFYHNAREAHGGIKNPRGLTKLDDRFSCYSCGQQKRELSVDCKFFRGCVSISRESILTSKEVERETDCRLVY